MISQFIDITVRPRPVAISPYSLANFSCEGTGNTLTWVVASAPLNDTIIQQRNITVTYNNSGSNLSSILTIIAMPINDGIEIGCIIVSNFHLVSYGLATLTIRG